MLPARCISFNAIPITALVASHSFALSPEDMPHLRPTRENFRVEGCPLGCDPESEVGATTFVPYPLSAPSITIPGQLIL